VTDWKDAQLPGVSKAEILHPSEGSPLYSTRRRIVDVVCGVCGERLAVVADDPDEPVFACWSPTVLMRHSTEGEPKWMVEFGRLPGAETEVWVHCFMHGDAVVVGESLVQAVAKYRRTGRRGRVPVEALSD